MSAKKNVMEPQMVRMSAELIARIDEARRRAPDLPSRPEMIRRMLTEWLDQNE